jgi:structure-specific recognition protein 1
MLTKYH